MEQQSKYQVIVSEQAASMLVHHAAFLAQASVQAAERLTVAFEEAASSLETLPQRCPWLIEPEIPTNVYRFLLFEKRYMLLFQIREDTVYIDYTIDCREDYAWLIQAK